MHNDNRQAGSPAHSRKRMPPGALCTVRTLFLLGALMTASGAGAAGISGPEVYVYIDTTVREATLDGMQRRLDLLSAADTDPGELRAVDADTRKAVDIVFANWGVTPAEHAAWGARHAERIERWLERHPERAREYEELESRFQSLSSQLNRMR